LMKNHSPPIGRTTMNAANEFSRLLDELAAHWTDPVLEILKATGTRRVSVEMEVGAWHTLRAVLRLELRQQAFRRSSLVSLATLMEEVLRKATLLVRRRFDAIEISRDVENRIRQS